MNGIRLLNPLTDFANLIAKYFHEMWDFLIFLGGVSAVICILTGAILEGVGVKVNKVTGRKLIMGGIILVIIIEYYIVFPPDFTIG
ncbi:MAG: hypothetical protein ACXABV_11675 [Candidatus Thorarchaeota archaeon]|jgi:hypothetical protein